MHLNLQLTQNIEIGAQRTYPQDSLDVETTDGGLEVRNLRAQDEPRQWQVSLPTVDLAGNVTDYNALQTMWGMTAKGTFRGLHTFNFMDFVENQVFRVRFASPLQITAAAGHLRHIDPITLKAVLETSPTPTVQPAITGTLTVGSLLTVSNGTWSGSPTSYAYQWTRDGADIGGAIASTYTLVSGDHAHMIGCYLTATDANGGSTRTWATDVGPIV